MNLMVKIFSFQFLFYISCISGLRAEMKSSMKEIFQEMYQHSFQLRSLGRFARANINNANVKDYNSRLIRDNQVVIETINDTAGDLGVPLAQAQEDPSIYKKLSPLKGESFERQYLLEIIKLERSIVNTLSNTWIPSTSNPVLKQMLQSFTQRYRNLLESAQNLAKKYRVKS